MERTEGGLSIIEVGLLLCVLGIVLAIAVPTFRERVRTSKIAEAPEQLQILHQRVAAYYSADWDSKTRCLPGSAGPTPEKPSANPVAVSFYAELEPGAESWKALQFQPRVPIRFRYSYLPQASGCALDNPDDKPLVILRAEGDLDGDEAFSMFERHGGVSDQGELVPVGVLQVARRVD